MDKRAHVARATELLDKADDALLPYAALELRMAMEAIAYGKLRAFATRIPTSVLDKWQPPQAMRALLEFEPHALSKHAGPLRGADTDRRTDSTGALAR
jgi:hypothetical protein